MAKKQETVETKNTSRVVFTRKDGSTREFSAEIHGEDFVKIADEFGETNKSSLEKREDL